MNNQKTYSMKAGNIERTWYIIDATDKTLGRIATAIAAKLQGKTKPQYTPHLDVGDYVVVINASKIQVTGQKATKKIYYRHSGYPGGIKAITFDKLLTKHPERIIESAIKGMLPKGPLGRQMFRKLKVYAGNEHPHTAQQPQPLEIED